MPRKLDLSRLNALLESAGIDLLIASSPDNVYYTSDLPTTHTAANRLLYTVRLSAPSYCVIPRNHDPILIVTNAALELALKHTRIKDVRTYGTGVYIVRPKKVSDYRRDGFEALLGVIQEFIPKTVGVEKKGLPIPVHESLATRLKEANLVAADSIFEEMRMIKTEDEIERFRKANKILCKAIRAVARETRPGVTEKRLHGVLKTTILESGGQSWHQTTIASGPENGPDIYNQPHDRKVRRGDIIRLDIGCVYDGYCADLSRNIAVGKPGNEAQELYEVLVEAEEESIERVRPGVKASEIHGFAQNYVRKRYDRNYTRGNVGHGVGIDLYDLPVLGPNDHHELAPGMTLSVEVPYHKYGLCGFNIEDSVVVTKKGHEVLSDLPRKFMTAGK